MSRTTLATGLLTLALAATTPAAFGTDAPAQTATQTATVARAAAPSITVAGTVPGRTKRAVVLQRRTGTTWATLARRTTTKAGSYSFTVPRLAQASTVRVQAPAVRRGKKTVPAWTSSSRTVPGTATPTPRPTPSPSLGSLRFRVTAFAQQDVVDMSQTDDLCGGISGTKTTTAQLRTPRAGDPTWPAGTSTVDGTTSIGLQADTETSSTSVLHGCQFDEDMNQSACTRTQVERPVDGLADTRVWIRIRKGSSQAEVIFDPGTPVLGNAGIEDTRCFVEETAAIDHADETKRTTTIPVARLFTTGPITVTNTGSQSWSTDHVGDPAQLDQRWSHSITIERVDASGRPLP